MMFDFGLVDCGACLLCCISGLFIVLCLRVLFCYCGSFGWFKLWDRVCYCYGFECWGYCLLRFGFVLLLGVFLLF